MWVGDVEVWAIALNPFIIEKEASFIFLNLTNVMQNTLPYLFVSIVWGLTWYLIKIQVDMVDPLWNAAYRFFSAALILFVICVVRKKSLRMNKKDHQLAATMGLFLFCLNYAMYYTAVQYLISGVVAVIVASMSLINAINGRIFLKNPLTFKVILGGFLGFLGVALIFISTTKNFSTHAQTTYSLLWGTILALCGSYMASLGNMVSSYSQKQDNRPPLIVSNAFSMLYGSVYLVLLACIKGAPLRFPLDTAYLSSLLIISVIGTAMAFHYYLTLLRKIGPERVAYVFVLNPIVAMFVSMYFEDVRINSLTVLGLALASLGNLVIITKKRSHISLALFK